MKKLNAYLLVLLALVSTVFATIAITTPSLIDQTDGVSITWTSATEKLQNCTLWNSTKITNTSLSVPLNVSTIWSAYYIPGPSATLGCQNTLSVSCMNCTANETCTTDYGTNATSSTFCVWDYETADIDDVMTDILGQGGVSFVDYLPLLAVFLVIGILVGAIVIIHYKIKKA